MKKIGCGLLVICLLAIPTVFGQSVIRSSATTPLEVGLLLTKRETNDFDKNQQLIYLAGIYWKLDRKKDAVETIESISDSYTKSLELIRYGKEYLKSAEPDEAVKLFLQVLNENTKSPAVNVTEREFRKIVIALIVIGKLGETVAFAETLVDIEDKASVLIQISEVLAEKGQHEKSNELAAKALETIEQSQWEDLKLLGELKIGNIYAKNGRTQPARELLEKGLSNYQSLEFSNTRKAEFDEQIIEFYRSLKDFDKAITFMEVSADLNNQEDLHKLLDLNRAAGRKEKADALYLQIVQLQNSDNHNDSAWTNIIYESISAKDFQKALEAAKKLDGVYYQFEFVDIFIQHNRPDLAAELLDSIRKNTEKIKSNEPESGMMSTSPQMRKADALSKVAARLIEMKKFAAALKIINAIEKPYYKAQALTNLAVKQNAKNSIGFLDQARSIMQKNKESLLDARKLIVRGEIGEAFAKMGQKGTALKVFAEILSDEEFAESTDLENLMLVGFYFEKAGLKSDAKIVNILNKFIEDWETENL